MSRLRRFPLAFFLGSFLMFQVQPLIAKSILPWFGGSPAVWTTCMLFFQVALLAGYAYAHWSDRLLEARRQALLHLGLLVGSLLVLPIVPSDGWKPSGSASPVVSILGLLGATVGAPFLMLSSTTPLLQAWLGRLRPGVPLYRLYALSNLGALLALVSYPFLIERAAPLPVQQRAWSLGYLGFVLVCGACAASVVMRRDSAGGDDSGGTPLAVAAGRRGKGASPREALLWLSLSACGVTNLLATTNQICQDIAPVPFLWVLPLALYLASLVVCFERDRWYARSVWGPALVVTLAALAWVQQRGVDAPITLQIGVHAGALFVCCMVCHGELVRLRPETGRLTSFYLWIACGGAMGGILVAVVAPLWFRGFWEFPLGITACAAALVLAIRSDTRLAPPRRRLAWVLLLVGLALPCAALVLPPLRDLDRAIVTSRNFFGVLRVEESAPNTFHWMHTLWHGRVRHGAQYRIKGKRLQPLSYYGLDSGVGVALRHHPRRSATDPALRPLRIGVVGLGAGTLAAYGAEGDTIRFYEIDPEVVRMAERYFTYLGDSRAGIEVVLGDARISMERERQGGELQRFDVLVVDAFSGDAPPIHLLTAECARLYGEHLHPDGILAFHITNRYLDLGPVVRGLARTLEREVLEVQDRERPRGGIAFSHWVLITSNAAFLEHPAVQDRALPPAEGPGPILWTDADNNLFQVLR